MPQRAPWLRRADQAIVAGLVAGGFAAALLWWIGQGGLTGRAIDIDEAAPQVAEYRVDINLAGWGELAQLPGIGPTLARRIVESREGQGPYRGLDDLRRVKGIGPKTLEAIRPFLLPVPADADVARR